MKARGGKGILTERRCEDILKERRDVGIFFRKGEFRPY